MGIRRQAWYSVFVMREGGNSFMILVGLCMLVFGMVIGLGFAQLYKPYRGETAVQPDAAQLNVVALPKANTKAADLRVSFAAALARDAYLLWRAASVTVHSPDATAYRVALEENGAAFGNRLGDVCGAAHGKAVTQRWKGFVDAFLLAEDPAQVTESIARFAETLTAISPAIAGDTVVAVLKDYTNYEKQAVDYARRGQTATALAAEWRASAQLEKIADILAAAMVRQYPEQFH